MSAYYVYGLFRPDTGVIFYVGMGKGKRAWDHVKCRKRGKSYKDNIICKVIDDQGYPDVPIVFFREGLSRHEAITLEIALIYAIGRYPHGPLANVVRGGEGLADPTPEFRQRHGQRMRVVLADPVIRDQMSAKAKARARTPEFEAKRAAAGRTAQSIAKKRAAKLGKPSAKKGRKFPSANAKAAQQGFGWITDGVIARRVKLEGLVLPKGWRRGRLPPSEAARAKMSAAVRPPQSEELRRKRSESQKGKAPVWMHTAEVKARAAARRRAAISMG